MSSKDTDVNGADQKGPTVGVYDAEKKRGVSITERAATEVQRIMQENGMDPAATWLRVGAKGGGCSGFSYVLDFDRNGPTEFDVTFQEHGVHIVVDKKSEFFMGGTRLDFNDGLLDRGFRFENPSATGSCGCGTSFSA